MMGAGAAPPVGKQEACKTYLEQTKLLVALASAFLFAPAGLIAILKDKPAKATSTEIACFIIAEVLFVVSVLAGYVVLGALAGSQDAGTFDVFRPATMWASRVQLSLYIAGLIVFVVLGVRLI